MGRRPKRKSDRPAQNAQRIKCNVYNRQKALPISKTSVQKAVGALCQFLSLECDELSVYFVSETKICELHGQFFDDPSPTDCITFPLDKSYLGDLFICPTAALRYDPEFPHLETTLYLVHGLLHLAGYGDIEPSERKAMRKMEKKCMDHLKRQGLGIER